jgi:AcrR family transcriptional regulator
VTAVLVNRYFGTKEKLFAEAVELAFADNSLFEGEFTELANRLTAVIMTKNDSDPKVALLLLLNSAPNPRAAEILRNCIARQFERPLKSLLQGSRAERASRNDPHPDRRFHTHAQSHWHQSSVRCGREPFQRGQDDVSTTDRQLSLVFQRYSLFPHLTVIGNLLLGLELRGAPLLGRLFGARRRRAMDRADA